MDRVTGKSYNWFFDQWINKAGWLDFSVQNLKWTGGKLRGDVKFNKGAYRFSCEILLDGPSSSEVKVVDIGVDGHFEVSCPKKPKLVTFDPWQRLLRTRSGEKTARLLDAGSQMKVWIEMDRATWQPHIGRDKVAAMPTQLDNMILVGSPETSPKLKPLFEKAGFKVKGTKLTYDGTTIDLNKGQAMALIDLPNGKQCIVCAGKSRLSASCERARLCLVDSLGRVLRAKTEPNRRGSLSFRL